MTNPPPNVQGDLRAAISHHQAGRLADAEPLYRRVLSAAPGHPDALHFLGLLAHQSGHHADAVELIGQALRAMPLHAPCHLHLGLALQSQGELDKALASYRRAIEIDPGLAEAHNNQGYVHLELGSPDQALPCLERALRLRPDFPEALNNLGMALEALGQPEQALHPLDHALALRPGYAEAHLNRGNALQALGRYDDALGAYDRVLELRPDHVDARNNRGQALEALGRVDDAIAGYRQAQALRPDFAPARWNEALALLRQGNFPDGWRLYEWRWQAVGRRALVRDFAEPRWWGDTPVDGRSILLHYEQGLGDTLQMLRYAPLLAARGARVLVEVPPSMATLAATLPGRPPGSITVVVEGEPLPPFDLQCPLMSLPLAFGTTLDTVPADVPYLQAPEPERVAWLSKLGRPKGQRIGLAWAGSAGQTATMRQRSLPLPLLLDRLLPALPGTTEFHSLQKDYGKGDAELLAADGRIRDHAAGLKDFAATAGLIAQLDLVITVDTAVAHLAGAMGKRVWVLLPCAADYRWLLGRPDSPWYPTMQLFRQARFGDWPAVLAAVAAAVAA